MFFFVFSLFVNVDGKMKSCCIFTTRYKKGLKMRLYLYKSAVFSKIGYFTKFTAHGEKRSFLFGTFYALFENKTRSI